MAKRVVGFVTAGVVGLVNTPLWAMCSLCRKTLEESGNAGLIHGFYWSIALIGSIPLIVLGLGIRYALRRYNP